MVGSPFSTHVQLKTVGHSVDLRQLCSFTTTGGFTIDWRNRCTSLQIQIRGSCFCFTCSVLFLLFSSSFSSSFFSSSSSSSFSSSFRCRCRCCCGDVVMWLNLFGDLTAYPIKGKTWARGTTAYATSSCEPSGKPTDRI